MSAAKFSAGQSVRFQAPSVTRKHGQDGYSVVRVMPLDSEEYEYRVKSPAEAHERVAKESQLTLVRSEEVLKPELEPRCNLGGVRWHKQTPRSVATLVKSARKKQSSSQHPRTEPHLEAKDAAWLDDWCAQKIITAPDESEAGIQALIQECEAAAQADGVSLRRALNLEGYSKLQDYFLDALDERAESEATGDKEDGNRGAPHGRHEDG